MSDRRTAVATGLMIATLLLLLIGACESDAPHLTTADTAWHEILPDSVLRREEFAAFKMIDVKRGTPPAVDSVLWGYRLVTVWHPEAGKPDWFRIRYSLLDKDGLVVTSSTSQAFGVGDTLRATATMTYAESRRVVGSRYDLLSP